MMCHLRNKVWIAALLIVLGSVLASCDQSTGLKLGEERVAPNETIIETEMIEQIKKVSLHRQQTDPDGLMRRFNQAKTIACAHGTLQVLADSVATAVGIFSSKNSQYPVTLRFANATKADDRDADLRGLSIRVHLPERQDGQGAAVQDFTMNSYPALFAGTPDDFLQFINAVASERLWWYLITHPKSLWVGFRGRSHPDSPLAIDYFSTTPYRHGKGVAVKYAMRPCDKPGSRVLSDNSNYLRDALQHDLGKNQCLNFQVQFQSNADLMPIEDASVIWPEEISPFVSVANIVLPAQRISDDVFECEQMRFNPWNSLPEHQPLGGINRVRRELYDVIGTFRTQQNQRRNDES